jgi:alcohol dehydrogenase class IV
VLSQLPAAVLFTPASEGLALEQDVFEGAELYVTEGCDGIIGAGSAAAMNVAKGIRLKVGHSLSLADYDSRVEGWRRITADVPPMIAIPMMPGSGAEVSGSAVITLDRTRRKAMITSPYLIASIIVADPNLLAPAEPAELAAGAFEAFARNVEAYLATARQPLCDAMALEGARLAAAALPQAARHPVDNDCAEQLLVASLMAGIASQKGQGAMCSMAYPLSLEYRLSHGNCGGALLSPVLDFQRPEAAERLERLSRQLGVSDIAAHARELAATSGLPVRLRDHGVAESAFGKLANEAILDVCHSSGPRACTMADLEDIYQAAW